MTEDTTRFALPLLSPGQAQKELFHNEALARIDVALHPAVEGPPQNVPSEDAASGLCWIVGDNPQGVWAGNAHAIAAFTDGGWRFITPAPGMTAWNKDDGHWFHWTGSGWSGATPVVGLTIGGVQVVGGRMRAIASPSGGTVIDVEARSALVSVIATLMSHGLIE